MKKVLLIIAVVILFSGCDLNMDNTPTKKVEDFLTKYQTLNVEVIKDLENTLKKDTSLDDDLRKEYSDFMKKHYQDLVYEIKDETIDGDYATVTTEITVRDYSSVVTNAQAYRIDNEGEFTDEEGNYDDLMFTKYRLDKLKEVDDTVTYTIEFSLHKEKDEWTLEQLSKEDLSKINGLYSN